MPVGGDRLRRGPPPVSSDSQEVRRQVLQDVTERLGGARCPRQARPHPHRCGLPELHDPHPGEWRVLPDDLQAALVAACREINR